jgi:hypothetical protein
MRKIDLSGEKYGRLKVIERAKPIPSPSRPHTAWLCACECGKKVVIKTNSLRTGNARSCGCLRVDVQKSKSGPKVKHQTEYNTWCRIKARCLNKKSKDYPNYGGRGITMCDDWVKSFYRFFDDMGPRPSKSYSIDRIDNNKGYCPENCRWATTSQQSRNKRNNRIISFNGKTMILQDWANELGICWTTLNERLQKQPLHIALKPKEGK